MTESASYPYDLFDAPNLGRSGLYVLDPRQTAHLMSRDVGVIRCSFMSILSTDTTKRTVPMVRVFKEKLCSLNFVLTKDRRSLKDAHKVVAKGKAIYEVDCSENGIKDYIQDILAEYYAMRALSKTEYNDVLVRYQPRPFIQVIHPALTNAEKVRLKETTKTDTQPSDSDDAELLKTLDTDAMMDDVPLGDAEEPEDEGDRVLMEGHEPAEVLAKRNKTPILTWDSVDHYLDDTAAGMLCPIIQFKYIEETRDILNGESRLHLRFEYKLSQKFHLGLNKAMSRMEFIRYQQKTVAELAENPAKRVRILED